MIHKISKRNKHSLWKSPSKTSRHYHSVTILIYLRCKFFSKQVLIIIYNLFENEKSGLKLFSDFFHKGKIYIWLIQSIDLLVWPVYHGFRDGDALEVGIKERIFAFHFLKDQV